MEDILVENKVSLLQQLIALEIAADKDVFSVKRNAAKLALQGMHIPTTKEEYWKYTRLAKIDKGNFQFKTANQEVEWDLAVPSSNCLVFVNGYYAPELSWVKAQAGVTFSSLSQAKENKEKLTQHFDSLAKSDSEVFSAMNTAFHQDGACLLIESNTEAEEIFYVLNLIDDEGVLAMPRHFVYLSKGSKAKIVFKTLSANTGKSFSNSLLEVILEENANLEVNKIQGENGNFQIATEEVKQARDSQFKINTFTLGGDLVRNNLNIALMGSNTQTWLNGFYPVSGKQHVDNHTFVLHDEPNCESHELYKGIIDDAATGVFNGKVFVDAKAQKTNAYQSNANMVLTDQAKANSKPELEIYADDVKCSHGSVTGQLDEEAIFYLRSRGLSHKSARSVLLHAFASDVLEHIGVEEIKEEIEKFIDSHFKAIK